MDGDAVGGRLRNQMPMNFLLYLLITGLLSLAPSTLLQNLPLFSKVIKQTIDLSVGDGYNPPPPSPPSPPPPTHEAWKTHKHHFSTRPLFLCSGFTPTGPYFRLPWRKSLDGRCAHILCAVIMVYSLFWSLGKDTDFHIDFTNRFVFSCEKMRSSISQKHVTSAALRSNLTWSNLQLPVWNCYIYPSLFWQSASVIITNKNICSWPSVKRSHWHKVFLMRGAD
jgi:hypothetical protein